MLSYSTMPSVKSVLATAASLAASAVLVRTIANDLVPCQFQDYFFSTLYTLLHRLSSQFTIIVDEYNGFSRNQLYKAAEIYLGTMISPSTQRLKVTKSHKDKNCKIAMARKEEVVDTFQGIQIKWRLVSRNVQMVDKVESQVSYFELSFHKKHREKVMDSYFQHVLNKAEKIKEKLKPLKLHALQHGRRINLRRLNLAGAWNSVNLEHPATFETLAMDPELKRAVMEDLKKFVERKELYRRVGKAWKRGYLLYGPPGTGKSSLIAAMANFLKFDIYDLELTDIGCNSEFRKLLLATENRSIIVIEDVDCTIDLQNQGWQKISRGGFGTVRSSFRTHTHQGSQVTLSGLLNFIDGLWSSCGDERIIMFTTNHKDRIDPALLRPGRMDMHIHMSYLKASAFNILASNYLAIDDHELFQEIWQLISEVEVTPAQVAEELMKSNDPDVSLGGLIRYLKGKKSECEEERKMSEEMKGDGEENMKDKWTADGGGGREERRMKT